MYLQNSVEALIFFISNGDVKEIFHNLQAYIFKSKGYEKNNFNVPYHSKEELGNVANFSYACSIFAIHNLLNPALRSQAFFTNIESHGKF